jgi:hypothetical protein
MKPAAARANDWLSAMQEQSVETTSGAAGNA